ncbi:hypothetical protein J31TS6_62210 [Brevibacillus reuszeri]|nr:hypothetical protein J31TS6_62210 [Brevibacillus reuszeri]
MPSSSIINNVEVEKSRPGIMVLEIVSPNANVFLIYASGLTATFGDTVTLDLNQFQDSDGDGLSGKLVITFDGTYWISSTTN